MATDMRSYLVKLDTLPHGWQVAGTILGGGAIAALAYGLSTAGLLDIASVLLTAWVTAFARMVLSGREPKATGNFAASKTLVATLVADSRKFMASRALLAKAVLALGYAILFVALRWIFSLVLHLVASPWVAIAVGLLIASLIASPVLWRNLAGTVRHAAASERAETAGADEVAGVASKDGEQQQ